MSVELKLMMFSDVERWQHFQSALEVYRPDAIFMGGDLTVDRFSAAHREAALLVPELWAKIAELLNSENMWDALPIWLREEVLSRAKREGNVDEGAYVYALMKHVKRVLREKYGAEAAGSTVLAINKIISTVKSPVENSFPVGEAKKEFGRVHPYFTALRMYGTEFYEALRLASQAGVHVFTVKGNHDAAFFEYRRELIESIPLCRDIEGKLAEFRGLKILGIGQQHTLTREGVTSLIDNITGPVDMVLCHASKQYYEQTLSLRPQLIYAHCVRGPNRLAIRKAHGVFLVYASFPHFAWVGAKDGQISFVKIMRYVAPRYAVVEQGLLRENGDKWVEFRPPRYIRRRQ